LELANRFLVVSGSVRSKRPRDKLVGAEQIAKRIASAIEAETTAQVSVREAEVSFKRLFPLRGYYRSPFTSFSPGSFEVTLEGDEIRVRYRLGLQPIIPLVAIAVILILALHTLQGVSYVLPALYGLIIFIGPFGYNVWRVRRYLQALIDRP
jgi:hypothetical protein